MDKKRFEKFERMAKVAVIFILAIIGGIIVAYYVSFPARMRILIIFLRYERRTGWVCERIFEEGEKALPYLIGGLESKKAAVRRRSAVILGRMEWKGFKDERALPALIALLSDPDAQVRQGAAFALGQLGDKSAVPHLVGKLSDPHKWVRVVAVQALGQLKDERAVPGVIKLLSAPEVWIKRRAARALEEITYQDFGEISDASEAQTQEIIQKCLNWWEANKDKYEAGVSKETADEGR